MNIPITKLNFKSIDETAVINVIRSGWVTQGPKVFQFEECVSRYVGAKYAIATSSCTTALHLALLVAGIKPGDEVITVSYSFIASANAIVYCGAKPVFVDININTYNIDIEKIEPAITRNTKAILVVHQVGIPADMDKISRIARKYKLMVIEDAACALGSEYKSKKIGSLSDFTCFSFHPKKIVTTGEGGMITTSKKEYAVELRCLRNHGASISDLARHHSKNITFEDYKKIGFNYRMSDISAAIGVSQMQRIDKLLILKRRIAERYNQAFGGIASLEIPALPDYVKHSYQSYILKLNSSSPISRDSLMHKLARRGIATRRIMGIHLEPCYRLKCGKAKLPNTETAVNQAILLPIYPQMTTEEEKHVIRSVITLIKNGSHD